MYHILTCQSLQASNSENCQVRESIQTPTAVDAANALLADPGLSGVNPRHLAKVPVQERGKVRFNAIIEAAEQLVLASGVDNISPHKIAKKAGIPPTSVYQYFPTMGALFSVMAEKHFLAAFHIVPEALEDTVVRSWRDLAIIIANSAFDFYTRDKISEILFLGVSLTPGVREYSTSRFTRLSLWYINYFNLLYKKSDLEGLPEKLAIALDVTKTVYIRSISLHGEIRESYKKEARCIVLSYLGEFFSALEEKKRAA